MLFLFVLFSCVKIYAHSQKNISGLKNKVIENSKLFDTDINKAYLDLGGLIKQSRKLKDSLSEMKLLEKKCRYFYYKSQIDSLIIASEQLQKAAGTYGNKYYEAMADVYLAETYSVNKFYDKALVHLTNAYNTLKQDDSKSKMIFYAKANVLSSFANVYMDKNEPRKAAQKLREEIKSGNELKDRGEFADFQYLNYSNISKVYVEYNLDSAYYFAMKSVGIKPKNVSDDKSMIDNYTVIGQYHEHLKDYENAVKNFHKALKIGKRTGIELNLNSIYKSLKEIYLTKNQKDSAEFYENKIKQNDLQMLQSKYNSLQEVMSKDQEEQKHSFNKRLLLLGISLVSVSLIFIFLFFRLRNNGNKNIETANVDSKPKQNAYLHETYKNLIALLENNDPGFMFAFENAFPEFSERLLKIHPDLQQSEIEFCALLKLKLSTKEIAKYTFIETRTVQNKKYRLRKKLDIPQQTDIYHWIDSI